MSLQSTLFLTNDFIQSVINSDSLESQHYINKTVIYERDKSASALAVSRPILFDEITEEITSSFGTKSPISMLMEYMQYSRARVNFVEVGQPEGPDHKPIFTMVAVVNGQPYARVQARTKKEARTGAAYLAWKTIILEEQDKLKNLMNLQLPIEDSIACMVYLEYLKQVLNNPMVFCGRRILSAVVMVDKELLGAGTNFRSIRVLSLGTGNRCISSQHLSLDGISVNDSHAEVIARRAFLREKLKNGESKLDDVCENSYKPVFDSPVQGLLRTKIEAGEGAIPAEKSHMQTWVGLMFGNRLRTMCCSDKILKWNVVGLQGALLSQILKPIYLSSVIVGENFIHGHALRALYYRLLKSDYLQLPQLMDKSVDTLNITSDHNSSSEIILPPHFSPMCPAIKQSSFINLFQQQETEKSSALAVVWYLGLDRAQVFDGTTGKLPNENDLSVHPCVCKRILFECFREISGKNSALTSEDYSSYDKNYKETDNDKSYYGYKQQAVAYQEAKRIFYQHMQQQGLGGWITKPVEIDFFQ